VGSQNQRDLHDQMKLRDLLPRGEAVEKERSRDFRHSREGRGRAEREKGGVSFQKTW